MIGMDAQRSERTSTQRTLAYGVHCFVAGCALAIVIRYMPLPAWLPAWVLYGILAPVIALVAFNVIRAGARRLTGR